MKLDQVFGVLLVLLAIYLAVNAADLPDTDELFPGLDLGRGAQIGGGGNGGGNDGGGGGGNGSNGGGSNDGGDGYHDGDGKEHDDGGGWHNDDWDGDGRQRDPERMVESSDLCVAVRDTTPYTDLDDDHDAAIVCMDAAGVVAGVSDTRYAPGDAVTRASTASAVLAMMDAANRLEAPGVNLRDVPAADGTQFRDVSEESPHREAIARLDRTPVLQGFVDLRYEPEGKVTRGQMASVLDRAYRYLNDAALPIGADRFWDDDRSVHEESINAVAAAGIMPGVDEERFAPQRSVLRGEMATYLARLMVRMEEKGRIQPVPDPSG
jgi:hypothetical protein